MATARPANAAMPPVSRTAPHPPEKRQGGRADGRAKEVHHAEDETRPVFPAPAAFPRRLPPAGAAPRRRRRQRRARRRLGVRERPEPRQDDRAHIHRRGERLRHYILSINLFLGNRYTG